MVTIHVLQPFSINLARHFEAGRYYEVDEVEARYAEANGFAKREESRLSKPIPELEKKNDAL